MKNRKFWLISLILVIGIFVYVYMNSGRYAIMKELNNLSFEDERVNMVIDRYDEYPSSLVMALSNNIELLDFVLDYPEKKGKVYADSTTSLYKKGEVPLFLQYDEGWGYGTYVDNILALNGCGPTSLAMVIVYLTGDTSVTPYTVSEYASKNGFYEKGIGTSWSLFTEGSSDFGIEAEVIGNNAKEIFSNLEEGNPIIASMGPGDFTKTGHFVVFAGTIDNKIVINDSNSLKNSSVLWDYDKIRYQIKNLWVFKKKGLKK